MWPRTLRGMSVEVSLLKPQVNYKNSSLVIYRSMKPVRITNVRCMKKYMNEKWPIEV